MDTMKAARVHEQGGPEVLKSENASADIVNPRRSIQATDNEGRPAMTSTATDAIQSSMPTLRVRKVSNAKAIYWAATGIVCSVMVFSAINFNLNNPLGPMKGGFAHLGFPNYFKIELTVAKVLGVFALLMPGIPTKIKEFAYSGFAITLISASIAHFSSGDGILFIIDPLIFLGVLIVSYLYFRKIDGTRRTV